MAIKPWPPDKDNWNRIYDKYAEWAAWYSGDPAELLDVYASRIAATKGTYNTIDYNTGYNSIHDSIGQFWAKDIQNQRKTMLHVPVAGDIAGVSADLLLSEPPDIKIPEAHEKTAKEGAKKTQDRLDEIIDEIDLYSRMLEGAETASPLGGFYAKVNWNPKFKPFPVISVAHADNAIPAFKWGFLTEVIFHKIIDIGSYDKVIRHLEIHRPGVIVNQLWKGKTGDLGQQVELSYHPATADTEEQVQTGLKGLACRYIPNKKPNRLWRDSDLGQSDLSGIEGLMDALDEVYTSWLRDVKLAKGRIIVPDYMLELDQETGKFNFDLDREIYESMNMGPVDPENSNQGITLSQFEIRAEEHQKTAYELLTQIYNNAGYSPASFGMNTEGGQIQTATEVKAREGKSFKTRNKKARYLQNGMEDILYILLQIDKIHFNSGIKPYRPQVILQDSIQTDPLEKSDSIEKLDRAAALTTDTKVRMLHPDWTEKQIKAEVTQIMKEQGMDVEPPEIRI
ncbi:phage portal protein [Halocella sp. SP3-1]|uniref:phage portal protein n=1 Tax=Halocella sp. SP3-1 TaxID=2382161 RepID=UPI000F75F937|nr:phage portal protein [Halocella sp. SP3-1]AZO95269.1 phage portal protein [Halocella sp. SP3-1]